MYEASALLFSPTSLILLNLHHYWIEFFFVRVASDGLLVLSPRKSTEYCKSSARLAYAFVSNLMRFAYDGLLALHGSVSVRVCLYGMIIHPVSV